VTPLPLFEIIYMKELIEMFSIIGTVVIGIAFLLGVVVMWTWIAFSAGAGSCH
jgi:hypothetical protein